MQPDGYVKRFQVNYDMTGEETFEIITESLGVNREHIRLTCGYREIYPNKQI